MSGENWVPHWVTRRDMEVGRGRGSRGHPHFVLKQRGLWNCEIHRQPRDGKRRRGNQVNCCCKDGGAGLSA